ncbi:response regulator [Kaistella flava (ex Peng et al. 2021)]|uniref:Response regulator n=1 Tax=Kaistella flava (ex Peng et al. 2021) TaxID=2038776 RepID=A0A7M2YAA5_9FLAO|nr:hypothetical protein [Kaistella flava (ex Peng et al. 2021)]QOW10283.1 response regulator [Kaistella flava (ex Peng et al. 2021)]
MSPNISILIVDDDLIKIYSIIKTIKEVTSTSLHIDQACDITEAYANLKVTKYHLLISDLLMPLHKDGPLLPSGGIILVKELYKERKGLYVPLYILGLTQHEEYVTNFNKLWHVILYESENESWKSYLRDLIFHIERIKNYLNSYIIETIFVEGKSDKIIIKSTIDFYFKQLSPSVLIETLATGAGASWVERKILIWAKSLNKHIDGKYIKAIGLFDNDDAGEKSITNILNVINENSAERRTFSLIRTESKYSNILKTINEKGVLLKTTIEDLVSIAVWREAEKLGWLTSRPHFAFLHLSKDNIHSEYFKNLGFDDDEIFFILHSVKDECKEAFANLAITSQENLLYVSYMLKNCFFKLKLLDV